MAYFKFIKYLKNNFIKDENTLLSKKLSNFLGIYYDNIPHEEYICSNSNCASAFFELLNYRGKKLLTFNIILNKFVREIPENNNYKYLYYEMLNDIEKLSKNKYNILTKNTDNILKLILELSNNKYSNNYMIYCDELVDNYKKENVFEYENIYIIIDTNKKLFNEMYEELTKNKYGRLIIIDFEWNIIHYIIMPFYLKNYKNDKNNKKLPQRC